MSAARIAGRVEAARERRAARAAADPHAGRCPHCGAAIDVLAVLGPARALVLDGMGSAEILDLSPPSPEGT